jgi:hypothetical protein
MGFDFALMRGLVRREAELLRESWPVQAEYFVTLCDTFKAQCVQSYDILSEVWKVDPVGKFEKGNNSLGDLAEVNGLGAKLSQGAQAPRDWADGRWAAVLNYCQDDVWKTKTLFEYAYTSTPVHRRTAARLLLPVPVWPKILPLCRKTAGENALPCILCAHLSH